jgi:hypothetical protein
MVSEPSALWRFPTFMKVAGFRSGDVIMHLAIENEQIHSCRAGVQGGKNHPDEIEPIGIPTDIYAGWGISASIVFRYNGDWHNLDR